MKDLVLGRNGGRQVVLRHPLIVWPLRVLLHLLVIPGMVVAFVLAVIAVLVEDWFESP